MDEHADVTREHLREPGALRIEPGKIDGLEPRKAGRNEGRVPASRAVDHLCGTVDGHDAAGNQVFAHEAGRQPVPAPNFEHDVAGLEGQPLHHPCEARRDRRGCWHRGSVRRSGWPGDG